MHADITDTNNVFGVENVSFGDDLSCCWGKITLSDGTNVSFTNGKSGYEDIEDLDWSNFVQCSFLNLCEAHKVTFVDVS